MFITLRFWVQFLSFYACLKEKCPNLLIWLFKFIWINAQFCRAIAANPKFDSRKANLGGLQPYLVKILTKAEKRHYNKKYCQLNSSHISRVFHKKFEENLFCAENSLVFSYADCLLNWSTCFQQQGLRRLLLSEHRTYRVPAYNPLVSRHHW